MQLHPYSAPTHTGRLLGMRALLLLLALWLSPSALRCQELAGFDDFLRRYRASPPAAQRELARAFIREQQARGGFPIVQPDGEAVFVYLGTDRVKEVRLVGDFLPISPTSVYWDTAGVAMERVGSVFYGRRRFEPDARLDYGFVVEGERVVDPLNPRTLFSGPGGGEASELVLPGHRLPTEVIARPDVPKGSVHVVAEPWASPKVSIYLPPGYDPAQDYPTVYTADGSAWLELIRLPTILDNLIAERTIEPVVAVMIDPAADRSSWYTYSPDYLAFLRRVVEHVDRSYATDARPGARLHAGSSAGGRATAYVGLDLPDLFSNLAMLSPSFFGPVSYLEPYFSGRKRPDPALRVWMSAGTYEGYILRDARAMEGYFERVGIPARAVYPHQGHSFGAWREGAVEMLKHFFAPAKENGAHPS